APFWVWNDDLSKEVMDEQLTDLHAKGIGGVFVHPRYGFITPYFSEKYFSMYKHSYDKLKELGMIMWLYDENGFPSGFASGLVIDEAPQAEQINLMPHSYEVLPGELKGEIVKVFKLEGSEYIDITDRFQEEKSKKGKYYVFELVPFQSRKFIDLLAKGVTEKFLDITVERGYKPFLGHEFGKMVPAIFQDEAYINPRDRNSLKWTQDLFPEFQNKWGYDLRLHLPSLLEETGDWKRVRYNYFSTLHDLFVERWGKVYYDYCEKNNLKFTGHYWEHEWPEPRRTPDNMAMYAWAQIPGIDILFNEYREDRRAQVGNVRSVKEARSVANQFGRSRVLSETYGGSGWGLRMEDMKRTGDWEFALGVNLLNEHLFHMTIMGKRKQDWPQSFHHEPYWKFYRKTADYFGRLSLVLSSGKEINKILVLEPTTTGWMYYSHTGSNERLDINADAFQAFITKLSKLHVEYDLGCEDIIKDVGKIEKGKFVVKERAYDVLVLPPGTENLNSSTVSLIEQYLADGGRIVSFVDAPMYIDGMKSDRTGLIAEKYGKNWRRVEQINGKTAEDLFASENFQVLNPGSIGGIVYHQRRQYKDGEILFLVNSSTDESASGKIRIKGRSVCRLDAIDGSIAKYPAVTEKDQSVLDFELPPVGSLLLFVSSSFVNVPEAEEEVRGGTVIASADDLPIKRISPNVIMLDYCDLKIDSKEEKGIYVNAAHNKVYQHHGLEKNPWELSFQYKSEILDKDKFPSNSGFEASFPFTVDAGVDRSTLKAVVEQPDIFRVWINGESVEASPGEHWLDHAFGVYNIGEFVNAGKNDITVTVAPFTLMAELESVYILGEFNLKPQRKGWKLVPVSSLSMGEWHKQGIPFYSDGVAYTKKYVIDAADKKHIVELGEWYGSAVEIRVNNEQAGVIAWPPYRLDITDKLVNGENEISVVVYGTLRNLLGPHHNPDTRLTGPWSWNSSPKVQPGGDKYFYLGYGLFEDFSVLEK
ncbi:glycosyl hydrolase, partial [candidate division KSB1 bacterium]